MSISSEQAREKTLSCQPQGALPKTPNLLGRDRRLGQGLRRTKTARVVTTGHDDTPEGTYLTFDFDQESEAAENTDTNCIPKGHILSHLYRH